MDRSTVIGLAAGLVLVWGSIFMGDGWSTFFDLVSFILVFGGTIAALMVSTPARELKQMPALIRDFFSFREPDLKHFVGEFYDLSRTARREGLLALDRRLGEVSDPFIRFGLEMAVDGNEEVEINTLLSERFANEMKKRQLGPRFFNNAGSYAPAFGMIGTLVGLIQMLQNLSDPTQIGSGMAVALITTFYGALLANLVFLPMASKMKAQTTSVQRAYQMIQAGVIAIVRGDSPSMIEKRLQLFLDDDTASSSKEEQAFQLSKAA